MVEPLLLSATKILTFSQHKQLTNASGFFFERDSHLFLVSSRHVMYDDPSQHLPDRLEITLHTSMTNMAETIQYSIPLYRDGSSLWRQANDNSGEVDVAVIELDRQTLPESFVYRAFTPEHIPDASTETAVGSILLVVGYPLGFHDTLHHVPVVRHGTLASSYGLRFQGEGFFLTDARTHRGISGSPVITYLPNEYRRDGELNCLLLGIHSARLDLGTRDIELDEVLGLNCSWYANILLTLTAT